MFTGRRYMGGRPKPDLRTASKASYNKFMEEYPHVTLTFKQYEQCIRRLNQETVKYILETGNIVTLQRGMGQLSINKKKGKKVYKDENGNHVLLRIDWIKSQKEGKKIYFFNNHTDGFSCVWYWFKYSASFKHFKVWKLKMARKNSKLLSDYLFRTDVEEKYHTKYHEFDLSHRNKYIKKIK